MASLAWCAGPLIVLGFVAWACWVFYEPVNR